MQPLNPFLAAFFKSPVPASCTPIHSHVLLVPTTHVLLTSRDSESGSPFTELITSDEFLSSHVLRVPSNGSLHNGRDAPNLRDVRGKAKQYSTHNSRTVVIKDSFVYTNKGFRSLVNAQLLYDAVWHTDAIDPKQWLIYYISKPLVGIVEEVTIPAAIFEEGIRKRKVVQNGSSDDDVSNSPKKKDIKTFHDLINNFPLIARQMQSGLEKLFREFTLALERPLPPPPSAAHIPDPEPEGPITSAVKKARSNSMSNGHTIGSNGSSAEGPFFPTDGEDVMRASLETAVMTAIDIFQAVDKQQLSLLGATTDLTGPIVERLLERYVTENTHGMVLPKLISLHRQEDLELEAKIRHMEYIDISQLGIFILGGSRGKHGLTLGLGKAVDEFRKMTGAMSPHDMIETLVSTLKSVARLTDSPKSGTNTEGPLEKPILTVNADTLVSLLLYVVIRANVRYLLARLSYMRNFIFISDIDHGEMGYALSTFEAVLSYLAKDSAGLRRASRRNKALWDAAAKGEVSGLKNIMEPDPNAIDEDEEEEPFGEASTRGRSVSLSSFASRSSRSSRGSSFGLSSSERFSQGSNLSHIFFFQNQGDEIGQDQPLVIPKRIKRVAMDTRSMSSGSEMSWHSRAASIATVGSMIEGDTSIERLSQTQDSFGESVVMMAVQHGRAEALKYLLSMSDYYPLNVVLEDCNHEETTLLSAAVQLGNTEIIDTVLDLVLTSATPDQIFKYFVLQDIWGRSVGHYLFHAPYLIQKIGKLLPWRQRDKNGQTPLFALCRSYDHTDYHAMVEAGLATAQVAQADGLPLHLDQHIDAKGNTLLHIVNDAELAFKILSHCDVDVNATNEKKFTPLMVASKYGRFDMVRTLFGDPRVDLAAKELRGLTAVELAKDDDVRNRIDDLTLFLMPPSERDRRITGVVRSFFVEDATIRLVIKSGAPEDSTSFTVTTSRRSLADFEHLAGLLAMENPASWIPNINGQRSPFQIPSKPSRSVLRDIQTKLDWFLKILLAHPTFSTHEMLWEFFLAPEIQPEMMEQRSNLKSQTRAEKVREELEPLNDVREVEQFVDHAREMIRSVNYSTKSTARRTNSVAVATADLHDAATLLTRAVSTLPFLPPGHITALETWVRTLDLTQANPHATLHSTFLALQSTVQALLFALAKPPAIITQIKTAKRTVERNYHSLARGSRWPLGLLDNQARADEEKRERARQGQAEVDNLGKELRYSQQVVASELAGWQEMHERIGRRALNQFARGMLTMERVRLEGIRRALRVLREGDDLMTPTHAVEVNDGTALVVDYGMGRENGMAILDDGVVAGGSGIGGGDVNGKRVAASADLLGPIDDGDGAANDVVAGPSGTRR
ncbi:hypothetical protein MKZ38_010090 [Zalerion maritima]|uniref:VPS9 domain-containing protein n=1 Tax=Zalerion maritima TaxID=339359 RepID=A0AAD5RSV3_9PEZI|nr:hypothetical protein MKZ38_010090 [Zalerion maritima]